MLVAFELKKTLTEVYELMDRDELSLWLAFFVVKQEREEKRRKNNKPRR